MNIIQQPTLFGEAKRLNFTSLEPNNLTIVSWNVQNPSEQRAEKQFSYLKQCHHDVQIVLLNELKAGKGLEIWKRNLEWEGFSVFVPTMVDMKTTEYLTIAAMRCEPGQCKQLAGFPWLTSKTRIISLEIEAPNFNGLIIGAYFPTHSQFSTASSVAIKQQFHDDFVSNLLKYRLFSARPVIIIGDLNILPENHLPPEPCFSVWDKFLPQLSKMDMVDLYAKLNPSSHDHSWESPTHGKRWRLDHVISDTGLVKKTRTCRLDHEPRLLNLSDHSAIVVSFGDREAPPSERCNPVH
jgi:exonuclease III